MIPYVAERTEADVRGGAVKLNKSVYFAEFAAMRRHGAFEDGPCEAATAAFSLAFECQREAIAGAGAVRLVLTPPTPFFGPLLFYDVLLNDDTVELASVVAEPDCWQRLDAAPE